MPAKLLDGRELAKKISEQLRQEVAALEKKTGRVPRLISLLIGSDPASSSYTKSQKRVAEQVGFRYELVTLPDDTTQAQLLEVIARLNRDVTVNGVMIHKPVPKQINYQEVANCLDSQKDVEGINIANIGKMMLGETKIIPCTPAACMELLKSSGVKLRGKEAVVVGVSDIVGKPLMLLLVKERATVTVCHSGTSDAGKLIDHVGKAEILLVAVGKPEMIKGAWVKEGAIVIDVGINSVDGKLVGDVEFGPAHERASFITPVPGGVGPVTALMLMRNGLQAFKMQNGLG